MMFKAVTLFLAFILLIGMLGKLIGPRTPRKPGPAIEAARKCPECATYVVGREPLPCKRPDCPYR
jgi:hypothetical protein